MAPMSKPSTAPTDGERGIARRAVLHRIIFFVTLVNVMASPAVAAIAFGIVVALAIVLLIERADHLALVDAVGRVPLRHRGVAMAVMSSAASMVATPVSSRSAERLGAAQSGEPPLRHASQLPPTA